MKRISQEQKKILSAQDVGFGSFTEWKKPAGQGSFPKTDEARELLQQAETCWNDSAAIAFRRQRERNMRYYIGRQWDDVIHTELGVMTEEEYIARQGKTPLKQNLIRASIKTLLGQFRRGSQKRMVICRNRKDQKASEMMSVALEAALDNNDAIERDVDMFEEFLISGGACCYSYYGYDIDRQCDMPMFRSVDMRKMFKTPGARDIMGKDVDFIGDFFDTTIDDIKQMYAKNPAQAKELVDIYGLENKRWYSYVSQDSDGLSTSTISFQFPASPERCRVYRICRLEGRFELYTHDYYDGTQTIFPYTSKNVEGIARENQNRIRIGKELGKDIPLIVSKKRYIRRWVYYHITPQGHLLFKKENPYAHKSHPYTFTFHPFKDGFTWSFVYDIIDQQRMINRMIILNDFLASAQAKGVLLVPDEVLGDDIRIEDIADQWAMFNGVIKFHAKPGVPLPTQIVNSQLNTTSLEILKVELQMLENIGGIHDALQGKRAAAGTPSALYEQEADNASTNILDFMASFSSFQNKRDFKILQLIQQYYNAPMYIALAGRDYEEEAHNYEPEKIRNLKFDTKIVKTADTATIRQYQDTLLNGLLEKGLIGIELYLENISTPFAQRMLAKIQAEKEKMAQGQPADPNMVAQLQGMLPQEQQLGREDASRLTKMLQKEAQPQVPQQVEQPPVNQLPVQQQLPINNLQ